MNQVRLKRQVRKINPIIFTHTTIRQINTKHKEGKKRKKEGKREREKDRERERDRERKTERERKIERQRERETERKKERKTNRRLPFAASKSAFLFESLILQCF
jgi:hypothetical protein